MNKLFLSFSFAFALNSRFTQSTGNDIRINQLGYYPSAKKIAVLVGDTKPGRFHVMPVKGSDTAFKGEALVN